MADNAEADAGLGGLVFATDDIGGVHYTINKITFGALDSQTLAASGNGVDSAGVQRVTLASDSTGQVKLAAGTAEFGKLAAGTAAIGKLVANSGVDIGDVDVTSVIPGTGATNLGKAIDNVVGSADTGIAVLAKHTEDQVHLPTADGDYDGLLLDSLGSLHVNAEAHHVFDTFNATTGWSALGNDTLNLATTKKHVSGTDALTFDKVNGAANTIFAGIQKTLSSTDLGAISPHDLLQGTFYIPSLTDVAYAFLRLGTDSTNYNEWRLEDTALTAATFEVGALSIGDANYAGITGNGWNPSAITYIAVGVAFDAETNTLSGIVFDEVSYHTNQHSSASLNSEVSSSVSSANVNLQKVGGSATDKGAGNVSNGSQRVVVATDDVNLAAIKTAVEIIDDWDETNRAAVNVISGQIGIAGGTGVDGATVPRVTLATDISLPLLHATDNAAIDLIATNQGSLIGPAVPTIDSYATAAVNVATGANSSLVAAPGASKQIWVYGLLLMANVAGTFSLQDEDDTALSGIMTIALAGGFSLDPSGNFSMPWIKVATNKALEIDAVTCTADGIITYAIVSV